MAKIPEGMKKDVFTSAIDGVFGCFKTADSFDLNYLLTTLRISELDKLKTATDAFDFKSINFEELIQRDIDYQRIDKDIIANYLE